MGKFRAPAPRKTWLWSALAPALGCCFQQFFFLNQNRSILRKNIGKQILNKKKTDELYNLFSFGKSVKNVIWGFMGAHSSLIVQWIRKSF